MTAQKESVVTRERLDQGISWEQWMATIDRSQDRFQENYDAMTLNPEDVAAIKALMEKPNGPRTMLAIGEAWCPDVVRGLGPAAKLCEATGLELRIFFRDQNLDIMNEFLYKGEFQSIPTMVFYDKDLNHLGTWHERAQKAREEMPVHYSPIGARLRNPDITPEERAQVQAEQLAFQRGPIWAGWRDAEISEMRALLEEAANRG